MNGRATRGLPLRGMPAENDGIGIWAAIDEIVKLLAMAVVLTMLFGDPWFALCGALGYTYAMGRIPILWADTDRTELESL